MGPASVRSGVTTRAMSNAVAWGNEVIHEIVHKSHIIPASLRVGHCTHSSRNPAPRALPDFLPHRTHFPGELPVVPVAGSIREEIADPRCGNLAPPRDLELFNSREQKIGILTRLESKLTC